MLYFKYMEKEKHHIHREAAEITLRRVKKYEDLNAPTNEERESFQRKNFGIMG